MYDELELFKFFKCISSINLYNYLNITMQICRLYNKKLHHNCWITTNLLWQRTLGSNCYAKHVPKQIKNNEQLKFVHIVHTYIILDIQHFINSG